MLLFIALANAHAFLHPPDADTIRGMPAAATLPDRIVAFLETTLVDGRSYPLFAALFGYGMVQIARRQEAEWVGVRKLLRRRALWILVLGVLHTVLLYYGDILASYGLLALVLVSSVRHTSKRLLIAAASWTVVGAALYGAMSAPADPADAATTYPWSVEQNPLVAMGDRYVSMFVSAPLFAITAAGAFLLGIWAARRSLFDDPRQHRQSLRRIVAIGIPVSFLGGVPLALYTSGILHGGAAEVVPVAVLHSLTGYAGGLAYAALIALWSLRVRRTPVITALQATGQRSLTCYLSQSVVWTVAFAPFLLDLGHRMTLWQSAVLAVGTWALTVVMAELMRRAGRRGPFEVLLRNLTYRERAARRD